MDGEVSPLLPVSHVIFYLRSLCGHNSVFIVVTMTMKVAYVPAAVICSYGVVSERRDFSYGTARL